MKKIIRKEVPCDILVNDSVWKDIIFNSSGTPSIQDIEIQQKTGGINISNHSNRFIFWKTRGNILELVEHSLDVNIDGNQVRFKFQDSPVIGDSISVWETKNSVVLLIATIGSVHRISFPYPKVISTRHQHVNSIFCDATSESINKPSTFHIINTASTLPYAGASYLTSDREAIFALALRSGAISVIKINPNTEKAVKVFDIKNDSLLRNLNIFSRSKDSQDSCILGVVMKYVEKNLFFVTLSFDGQLKSWSYDMKNVGSLDTLTYCETRNLGIQSHLIRKPANENDSSIWVYLCLEDGNSCFIKFDVTARGSIEFKTKVTKLPGFISSQMNQLIDFIIIKDILWCVWHTIENESVVTAYYSTSEHEWSFAQLEPLNPTNITLCPQRKLSDLIFKPGLFSKNDITKALEIINTNIELDPHLTLREKVKHVVESNIQSQINELSTNGMDVEYSQADCIEIAERCWSEFYSCCIQYREMSLPPLGMLYINTADLILIIKKNSFSLLRPLSVIDDKFKKCLRHDEFLRFINYLNLLQLDVNVSQELSMALSTGGLTSFETVLRDLDERDLNTIFDNGVDIENPIKNENIEEQLQEYTELLLQLLNKKLKEDINIGKQYFNSVVGINALTTSMNQIAETKLRLCCNLLIILHKNQMGTHYSNQLWDVIRDAWIVTWLYHSTDEQTNESVLLNYISQTPIRHNDMIHNIELLLAHDTSNIVKFLSTPNLNHAYLLQDLSRILDYSTWKFDLIKSYLYTGDMDKAFEIVQQFSKHESIDYFLNIVDIFNKYCEPSLERCTSNMSSHVGTMYQYDQSNNFIVCREYVIEIIHLALKSIKKSNEKDNSVLHSILFENYLKLKNYNKAFDTILNNNDYDRKIVNLHSLILNMFENKHSKQLLNLLIENSMGRNLAPEILNFCHKRIVFPIDQSETYFEFLFNFYIHNSNFFYAAQVKFDHALCYPKDIQKKVECLVLCISTLNLESDPDRQFINRKKDVTKLDYKVYNNEKIYTESIIEKVTLKEIKNIYQLEKSKLYIKECPYDADLDEVISLLTHAGLYKKALQLAYMWQVDLQPIFISLTQRCLQDETNDWNWIFLNDLHDHTNMRQDIHTLMVKLLEVLMNKFELKDEKVILKCICEKILSYGYDIPDFCKEKYYKLNAGELVNLYHKNGCIEKAYGLSVEILDTLMKENKNNKFGFSKLTADSKELYCGLQYIQYVVVELSLQDTLQDEHELLKHKLNSFEQFAQTITREKFNLLRV